ncbi:MAG: S9 family peptidase, partial [Pseudomonadales bacterium]|nr:S9 family peptidase [Pseudomonadales bacterium]
LIILSLVWGHSNPAFAQDTVEPSQLEPSQLTPSQLTLERLFSGEEFDLEEFGPARWLADGSAYTLLEDSEAVEERKDIVRYDPLSGQRQVLVSAALLQPTGADEALEIDDYSWSNNGSKVLIYTNSQRVWRTNSRGDYWVLDIATAALSQLGRDFPEATLMFATFSPDDSRVAYVQGNNLYVEDLATAQVNQITSDGSETLINGTFDWVYEEEFGLQNGFRWSPDGHRIAYWQLDSEGVEMFTLINNTDTLYPELTRFPYPKVGQMNSSARLGVIDAAGGDTTWIQLDGDPRQHYPVYLEWAGNSDELVIQQLNRRQNVNRLLLAQAEDGSIQTLLTETDPAWLDPVSDFQWFDEGRSFLWVSEKNGWRQIFRVSRDGKNQTLLTPGNYDAISILHADVDAEKGHVYFIASPDDPQRRYLYRVPLNGSGVAERLTPADQAGDHRYLIAADSHFAVHWYSRRDLPTEIDLVSLPEHERIRLFTDNSAVRAAYKALARGQSEFFQVTSAEGITMEGFLRLPPDFDARRKYPVIFFVYGEPAAQTARDVWSPQNLWHVMMSQQGYVIATLDNRGQPAPKGRQWRKSIYRQLGIINMRDQMLGAQALLADRPYLDSERVGVWGHSGGGTSTLHLMFRYPEVYHVGVAQAPVPDITLYDSIYQERYSGILPEDAEQYEAAKAINQAAGLAGKLLLVHGTGDDNVHYQGSERLINKLVEAGKQFDLMIYPNRNHRISGDEDGTSLHLGTLRTRYFLEHLPPGPR